MRSFKVEYSSKWHDTKDGKGQNKNIRIPNEGPLQSYSQVDHFAYPRI